MRRFLLSINLAATIFVAMQAKAQSILPLQDGKPARYSAFIEMPKAYISGICVLVYENDCIKGSMFNEFGMSAIDFSYLPEKEKIQIHNVIGMLDKWYIKKVMKKDIRMLMAALEEGRTEYTDKKNNLKFHLSPIETEETNNIEDYDITE